MYAIILHHRRLRQGVVATYKIKAMADYIAKRENMKLETKRAHDHYTVEKISE